MQQQICVPTDDVPLPAPTTITRSSYERNLLVPYATIDVAIATNIHSSHTQLLYGINYKKQLKKLNHWIFLSLEYS